MKSSLYFIPGFCFEASIVQESVLKKLQCHCLDYMDISVKDIDVVTEVLSKKIENNSILIGWSFGGLIAINLAVKYPGKVKKLILLASQPRFIEDVNWRGIDENNFALLSELPLKDIDKFKKYFLSIVNYPNKKRVFKKYLDVYMNVALQAEWLIALEVLDLRKAFSLLNIDTLYLQGKEDAILPENAMAIEKLNANAVSVVIPGAGHSGFLTHGEIYLEIIKEYMGDV